MNKREELRFTYTNWRGETSQRRVHPQRIYFGNTEFHPESQWLMEAVDLDKAVLRDFALKDMIFNSEEID